MKKKVIICILLIILISMIFFITRKDIENGSEEKESLLPVNYVEENQETNKESNQEKITQIVKDQGLQANENIYEIAQEYDGREVVVVKTNIKYKVALAGMIKKQKPEFNEINEIMEKAPKHTGIWIAENSREKFLEVLKKITKLTYAINEDGFLEQKESWIMNDCDKSILALLNDKKLHVFDISSTTYIVDDVTGEIQEYPFEEMDPYTDYEYFEDNDKEMYILSEGIEGKVKTDECLKKIFE